MPDIAARLHRGLRGWLAEPPRARRVYPAALLALTLLVWFPSLFTGLGDPSQDAFYHITQAALHHSPGDIAGWFEHGYWAYTHYEYRPLTRLSLLADYLVWGRRPFGFHLTNVLLHFACAFLLAAAVARADAPIWAARLSGAAAAAFPSGQMAVSWINGRQDVLCAVFALGAVCLFLNWLAGRPWPHLAGACVCALLSALAKEPGAAVPLFLVGAILLLPSPRKGETRLGAVGIVAAALVPYLWLRVRAWPLGDYLAQNAAQLRPLSVSLRWLFGDLLLPRPYELVTTWRQQGIYLLFSPLFPKLLVEQVAFWVGLAALLARQRRLLLLGLWWKLIFFLPVYNLYWNPAFTHYRYLPHLGNAWLVGLAAWELAGSAAARMQRWGRPLLRGVLIAAGLVLLLGYYAAQLEDRWPTWKLIRQGGPAPPAAFCRDLHGLDAPSPP